MLQSIKEHAGTIATLVSIFAFGLTGVYWFSNLETRVDAMERQYALLTAGKGARGDLCSQIMTAHLEAIMRSDGRRAEVTSAELERFGCDEFAALSSSPIGELEEAEMLANPNGR